MKPLLALTTAAIISTAHAQEPRLHLPPLDRHLPARVETIYNAMAPRIDTRVAMDTVTFMSEYWRLAGNPGYDKSIDFIAERLERGGYPRQTAQRGIAHWIERFDNAGQGWELHRGTLSIEGRTREVVLSREQDHVALCINSFPTPEGGVIASLVDVGAGNVSDFE